jgi:hypothetical protein
MAAHVELCTKLDMHGVSIFFAGEGNKPVNILSYSEVHMW